MERQVDARPLRDEPLSVVLYTNSLAMGGMEWEIQSLSTGLKRQGARVSVVCWDLPAVAALRDNLRAAGIDVYAMATHGRGIRQRLQSFWQLVSIFRRQRPCVLHIYNGWVCGGNVVLLAAKLAGIRSIVRSDFQLTDEPLSRSQRWMIRLRDRILSRAICISRANLREHVGRLGRDPRKFVISPLGLDLNRFRLGAVDRHAVRRLVDAKDDTIVVGMLARLADAEKGGEHFIDMARMLAKDTTQYRCVVVGDGPHREELERRADGVVTFLGRYPDAAECYAAMDVFVMPSLSEGGPWTVLEAMAMQRPVVATPVGMVPEVIANGVNGRIVPPADPQALADAVRAYAADPAETQQLARRGRATIEHEYSERAMLDRLTRLYREVSRPTR